MSAGVVLPVGWADLSMVVVAGSSHGALLSLLPTQGLAAQLDAMGVVDDAVQDGIGESGIADQVVPAVHHVLDNLVKCMARQGHLLAQGRRGRRPECSSYRSRSAVRGCRRYRAGLPSPPHPAGPVPGWRKLPACR